MDISSYQGWYDGNYLRSSYEYVFVKICECQQVRYTVEEKLYTFEDGTSYKPDFHIYDTTNNNLLRIVEIKSNKPDRLILAEKTKKKMSDEYFLEVHIILYKDLEILCNSYDLNIKKLIKEWKTMDGVFKSNILSDLLNPMYGRSQSEDSKTKIGLKTTSRFLNKDFKIKHGNSVKEAMKNIDMKIFNQRESAPFVIINCLGCGKEFEVISTEKGLRQKYCSNECKGTYGNKVVSQNKRENTFKKYNDAKEEIIAYVKSNRTLIHGIPKNRIKVRLLILLQHILDKYGINDPRVILYMFFGSYTGSFNKLTDYFEKEI